MKRKFFIVLGLLLFLVGFLLIASVYLTTFRRIPPDARIPLFTLDWEFGALKQTSNGSDKDLPKVGSKEKKDSARLRAVFSLEIPSIGVKEKVYEGTSKRVLMSGPGHIKGTALPGEKGNCVVSGHRVTYGGPFRNLHKLEKGDEVIVRYSGRRFVYIVVWKKRVLPREVWVAAPTELPSLTLTTCDPPYSAKYRLVVRAVLSEKK